MTFFKKKDFLGKFRNLMKGELYFDNKSNDEKHLFNKISSTSNYGYYYHPYGYFFRRPKWISNDLGFRCKYDLHTLKKDRKKYFIIMILGGAAGQNPLVDDDNLYSNKLESVLNKEFLSKSTKNILVLNLCIQGQTLLAQTINFILFAQSLNPDVVVSFSGITDINRCFHNDKNLLNIYNINYESIFEGWARHIHEKKIDLDFDYDNQTFLKKKIKSKNDNSDIVKTFIIRLKQLKNVIKYIKSEFILILHPWIKSKKKLSNEENKILSNEYKTRPFLTETEEIYNLLSLKLEKMNDLNFLDLHKNFQKLSDQTHFASLDKTNVEGDQYIFDFLYKKIKPIIVKNLQ